MASSWFSVTSQASSVYAVSASHIPFSAKPKLRFLSKPRRSSYPVVKAQSNKTSGSFLEEISKSLDRDREAKPSHVKRSVMDDVDQKHGEVVAMVGLEDLLQREGLLTQRIQQEFRSGEEYWALERKLCYALSNKNKICLEDVMRADHLRSFYHRVKNLLLYKLRGEEVNELHMEFLSISAFLVEVADDMIDYKAKRISEAEDNYKETMKSLDSNYQRRCEEAIKEGGENSGRPLGTWNIPAVISNEEAFRAAAV